MVKKITMWEDDFGEIHHTKKSAEENSIDHRKKHIAYTISDLVYSHMNYDEFDAYDFIMEECDEMINLLTQWKQLHER